MLGSTPICRMYCALVSRSLRPYRRVALVVVGNEREAPAGVRHHVLLAVLQHLQHVRQTDLHALEVRRLVIARAAQIRQQPHAVLLEEGRAVLLHGEREKTESHFVELLQNQFDASRVDDVVTTLRVVAGDIAQRPARLLAHAHVGRLDETKQNGKGATLNDDCGLGLRHGERGYLLFGSGGDIRDDPRRFVLKTGAIVVI